MRRKAFLMAAVMAAVALAMPAAQAQTVDEILAKYIEAKGGRQAIDAAKTAKASGRMTIGPGMEAPFTITWKKPGMVRMEFTVQGMTGVQAYDGTTGWWIMPFMGKNDAEKVGEDELRNLQEMSDMDGPLVDYKTKGHQVELLGKETVEGTEVYKLKVTRKNGDVSTTFLDAEAFLEIKEQGKRTIRGQEMEYETSLGDYKEVGGLMIAHSIQSKAGPMTQTMTLEKFEVNPTVQDDSFKMPAPKAEPAAK